MSLWLEQTNREGATVVLPSGRLELSTYRELRDHLTKAGADSPRAVIVDLRELEIDSTSALSVFTTVHSQLAQWPGIPLMLADGNEANRRLLATGRTRRFVPVHDTVTEAIDAIGLPPPRRVSRVELGNDIRSARIAREFAREVCIEWGVRSPVLNDAVLVTSELVTNVVMHTMSTARVRLELRRGVLSIAVADDAPEPAFVRDPGADLRGLGGMLLVAQASTVWGCLPTSDGGKVVWATLPER